MTTTNAIAMILSVISTFAVIGGAMWMMRDLPKREHGLTFDEIVQLNAQQADQQIVVLKTVLGRDLEGAAPSPNGAPSPGLAGPVDSNFELDNPSQRWMDSFADAKAHDVFEELPPEKLPSDFMPGDPIPGIDMPPGTDLAGENF